MTSKPRAAPPESALTRRRVLSSTLAGVVAGLAPGSAGGVSAGGQKSRRLSPAELKARIRGPISAIPTPFTADERVDFDGVRRIVRLGLRHGIRVYELTAGDSQYHALGYEEIKELTRVLVDAAGGNGTVIAAANAWWTARTVDYARFAESVGADGIQVLANARGTDDTNFELFRRLSEETRLGIVLHGRFSLRLIDRLCSIDSIVAIKEDTTEKDMFDLQTKFGTRLAVFGGGQKWRFLVGHTYGMMAYLSTFATFAPEIAVRFWKAIESEDLRAARDVVIRYDQPLFDLMLGGPRPFHAYWRGVLEYFGIAKRYLRTPEPICTDEDMGRIKRLMNGLELWPESAS